MHLSGQTCHLQICYLFRFGIVKEFGIYRFGALQTFITLDNYLLILPSFFFVIQRLEIKREFW